MGKINYQNLPNTTTPLNATNLNNMQNIVEIGSNTNGNYMKYDDGTLICWGRKSVEDVSFTQLQAGINYSSVQTITYPVSFYSNSSVATSISLRTSNICWVANVVSSASSCTYLVVNSSVSSRTVSVEWTAIGRWKA